jgi:hypothetical protein
LSQPPPRPWPRLPYDPRPPPHRSCLPATPDFAGLGSREERAARPHLHAAPRRPAAPTAKRRRCWPRCCPTLVPWQGRGAWGVRAAWRTTTRFPEKTYPLPPPLVGAGGQGGAGIQQGMTRMWYKGVACASTWRRMGVGENICHILSRQGYCQHEEPMLQYAQCCHSAGVRLFV